MSFVSDSFKSAVFVDPSMFGHGSGGLLVLLECKFSDTGLDQCLYTLVIRSDCEEQTDLGLVCSNRKEKSCFVFMSALVIMNLPRNGRWSFADPAFYLFQCKH